MEHNSIDNYGKPVESAFEPIAVGEATKASPDELDAQPRKEDTETKVEIAEDRQ
jgi:hypothetical protein